MEWPSKRVAPGGIFQPAKVAYSPQTRDFLKVLLEESRLTMQQMRKVNYSLRSGEPLPPLGSGDGGRSSRRLPRVLVRPGTSKRRSQSTIARSGAYEREKFVPLHPKVDGEKAKKHLQDLMAFGKDIGFTPRKPPRRKPKAAPGESPRENRFDQLLREIEERREWLKKMTELGEGKKYEAVIEQQIQGKLREIEKLKIGGENEDK